MTRLPPQTPERRHERTLSDSDIEAIVEKTSDVLMQKFYTNLGRGIWAVVWKAVVLGALALATYGMVTGKK